MSVTTQDIRSCPECENFITDRNGMPIRRREPTILEHPLSYCVVALKERVRSLRDKEHRRKKLSVQHRLAEIFEEQLIEICQRSGFGDTADSMYEALAATRENIIERYDEWQEPKRFDRKGRPIW